MGTSSIYPGPSINPLLPSDFDPDSIDGSGHDDNDNDANDNGSVPLDNTSNDIVNWSGVKTGMSKYTTGSAGSSHNLRSTISNYVKARGGSRSSGHSAKSGIKTAVNLGNFLSSIVSDGQEITFKKLNIEYQNRSTKEILSDLVNVIAPIPIDKEDSIARKALIATLEDLNEESIFSDIDSITFNLIISRYIESYIYERLLNDLSSRIELNASSVKKAIMIEEEIKNYINSNVEVTFSVVDFSTIDFNDNNTMEEIEDIYSKCYLVLEEMI